jgi:RsiW-degrading membrane proteinase PrsW (M82 family)
VAALIGFLLVVVVGILPMLAYALILWWFDRYEKEPLALLIAAFLWGAVPAIVFSLIAEYALGFPISHFVEPVAADMIGGAVVAPVAEEIFKGTALLLLLLLFRHEIDSPLDGIIYGGLVGFGFAAVENVFYFASAFMESGPGGMVVLAILRALLFGLNHALFTGLTGLGLALMRTAPSSSVKAIAPVAGLGLGIAAHSIHNGSVMLGSELCWPCAITFASDWGGVLILLVVMTWTSVREQRWITDFLMEEIKLGTLSQDDYTVVCSYVSRVATRARALFSGDLKRWWHLGRYHRLATELAFNKRRLTLFPAEEETQAHVAQLREQVREMTNDQQCQQ